ncbi:MAG: hypothetical protein AB8B55_23875 [Mariniblastus sp.]
MSKSISQMSQRVAAAMFMFCIFNCTEVVQAQLRPIPVQTNNQQVSWQQTINGSPRSVLVPQYKVTQVVPTQPSSHSQVPIYVPTYPGTTMAPAPTIESVSMNFSEATFATCNCQMQGCRSCERLAQRIRPDISNRQHAPGNMSPRYPYETERFYYYQRPYNSNHVSNKNNESMMNGNGQQVHSRPYSNSTLQALNKQGEKNLAAYGPELVEDGFLEFADWRDHKKARLEWESNQPPVQKNARLALPQPNRRTSR